MSMQTPRAGETGLEQQQMCGTWCAVVGPLFRKEYKMTTRLVGSKTQHNGLEKKTVYGACSGTSSISWRPRTANLLLLLEIPALDGNSGCFSVTCKYFSLKYIAVAVVIDDSFSYLIQFIVPQEA